MGITRNIDCIHVKNIGYVRDCKLKNSFLGLNNGCVLVREDYCKDQVKYEKPSFVPPLQKA